MSEVHQISIDDELKNISKHPIDVSEQLADIMTDIKSYGALADYGNGNTDNTTFINNAANYCRTNNKPLRIPQGNFLIKGQIDLRGITNIIMDGCIKVDSSFTSGVAVLLGSSSSSSMLSNCKIDINVERITKDWTDSQTGVQINNLAHSFVKVINANSFQTGLNVTSNGASNIGTAWNTFIVNKIYNNQTNLLVDTQSTTGYTNENVFMGGNYGWGTTAIYLNMFAGGQAPNHNTFYHPDFNYSTTGAVIDHGNDNHFQDTRCEGVTTIANFNNDSWQNMIEIGHYGSQYNFTDTSQSKTNRVYRTNDTIVAYPVNKHTSLKNASITSTNKLFVPGFSIRISTLPSEYVWRNSSSVNSEVQLIPGGLKLNNINAIGFNVDTSFNKNIIFGTYTPWPQVEDSNKIAVIVPFDFNGNLLTDSAGTNNWVVGGSYVSGNMPLTWSTNFGGCYISSALRSIDGQTYISSIDTQQRGANRIGLTVRPEVAYIWVGITGKSSTINASLSDIYVLTLDKARPRTWVGYTGTQLNPELMYFDAIPSSGTWNQGDTVYNYSPIAGGNIGWVCTTAGTPGTWKTFGTIGA